MKIMEKPAGTPDKVSAEAESPQRTADEAPDPEEDDLDDLDGMPSVSECCACANSKNLSNQTSSMSFPLLRLTKKPTHPPRLDRGGLTIMVQILMLMATRMTLARNCTNKWRP